MFFENRIRENSFTIAPLTRPLSKLQQSVDLEMSREKSSRSVERRVRSKQRKFELSFLHVTSIVTLKNINFMLI